MMYRHNPWYDDEIEGDLYRGYTTSGHSSGVGVLGNGVYLTWVRDIAEAFARISSEKYGGKGIVDTYTLKPGLAFLERHSPTWDGILRGLGVDPYGVTMAGPVFSTVLTDAIISAGYDGAISSDPYDGLVVFDPSKVVGYADPLLCDCGKRKLRCGRCNHIYCAFGCEPYDACPECEICKKCGNDELDECYECDELYCGDCDGYDCPHCS